MCASMAARPCRSAWPPLTRALLLARHVICIICRTHEESPIVASPMLALLVLELIGTHTAGFECS